MPCSCRPRSARSDWLDSTDPLLRCDRAEPELWKDQRESTDIDEPMDPAEANEKRLANEAHDAALPTQSTESWEPIDRIEFSDQSDHMPLRVVPQRQPSSGATRRTTLSSTCAQ